MKEEKIITIDGSKFSDLDGFVTEFGSAVFGDDKTWTGGLDQLDSLLKGGYGSPEGSFTIRWLNAPKSQEYLGYKAMIEWLETRISKVHPTNKERWAKRIELAKYNIGETIFLMLIDIIVRHKNITLILE